MRSATLARLVPLLAMSATFACGQQQPAQQAAPVAAAPGVPAQPGMPQMPMQPGMPQQVPVQPGMPYQVAMQPVAMPTLQPAADFVTQHMTMRAQQFAAGMAPVTPLQQGMLVTGATQDYNVPLQGGHCYTILGVGGAGVTDLDLYLFDMAGQQLAQDTATDNFPVFRHCVALPGVYRVQTKMYTGAGTYGVQVFGN